MSRRRRRRSPLRRSPLRSSEYRVFGQMVQTKSSANEVWSNGSDEVLGQMANGSDEVLDKWSLVSDEVLGRINKSLLSYWYYIFSLTCCYSFIIIHMQFAALNSIRTLPSSRRLAVQNLFSSSTSSLSKMYTVCSCPVAMTASATCCMKESIDSH